MKEVWGSLLFFPQKLVDGWNHFWFEFDGEAQLAVFRPAFAILMFFFAASRTSDLQMLFSNHGIMPVNIIPDSPETHFRFSILSLYDSIGLIWVLHVALLSSLLMLAFNILPRASAIVAFLCHVNFMNRNPAVIYGVDTVSAFYLFYLCFMDYRPHPLRKMTDLRGMMGSVAMRLSQLQLCIIYGYSGLDKVQGVSWWKGEAMWYVFANPQLSHFNFAWIAHFPVLVVIATYTSLFWEVYFPAVVWVPKLRYPALLMGVLIHLGIFFVMGLTSFASMMVLIYILFLKSEDALKITQCVKKVLKNRKVSLADADQSYV